MKLAIGYQACFEIRREVYPWAVGTGLRVVYLSDLHFNRFSGAMAANVGEMLRELAPELVLLGGDYVDSSKGLLHFERMLSDMPRGARVVAVAGNHDRWREKRLRRIVEGVGGFWLGKESVILFVRGVRVRIDGWEGSSGAHDGMAYGRIDLRVWVLHRPLDVVDMADRYNLIFAGHLHGCQVVLWETERGLYPGRWFYRWNRLSWRSGSCHYLISKGLGDTVPLRYNCNKDIIIVDITPKS